MSEGLTQTKTSTLSETWPEIDGNGGRLVAGLTFGKPGRNKSESAFFPPVEKLGHYERARRGWPCRGSSDLRRSPEWLPDWQLASRQDAVAAKGRAPMVVSVLFRHRARSGGL